MACVSTIAASVFYPEERKKGYGEYWDILGKLH